MKQGEFMEAFVETLRSIIEFLFALDKDTFENTREKEWLKVAYIVYRVLMSIMCIITMICMITCFIIGADYLSQGNMKSGLKLVFTALLLVVAIYILFFRSVQKRK